MKLIIHFLALALATTTFAQQSNINNNPLDLLRRSILKTNQDLNFQDLTELSISDQTTSLQSGVTHTYVQQYYQGIEIFNALSSIHILENGNVLQINDRFEAYLNARANSSVPGFTAIEALQQVATEVYSQPTSPFILLETPIGDHKQQLLSNGGISRKPIPAKLVYFVSNNNQLRLSWNLTINEKNSSDSWDYKIDVFTGQILNKTNRTHNCKHFTSNDTTNEEHSPEGNNHTNTNSHSRLSGSYNVFEFPVEHPLKGSRSIAVTPHDQTASPFGWHDTNGIPGAEYTTTRGNNTRVWDDGNNPGYMPDGGSSLNFDFPLNLNAQPAQNIDASITHAFYSVNRLHDVFYHYGFDEQHGNFQENNYNNGGMASDILKVNVQGGTVPCNASMIVPPDGLEPEMSFVPCFNRDIAFSNNVIAHMYGHGVTKRLVAGASVTNCLDNAENMGEGWSDYMSLIFTMKSTDQATTGRPVFDWMVDDPNGARPYLYTTDMAVNPSTYNTIIGSTFPQQLGAVWTTMLWDLTWKFIDLYGFDPDIINGTGGNNMALQLIMEGLKLTPCNPGFVDGRNALLNADKAINGNAHECLIWEVFAKRGLGFSANQASVHNIADGTEAFDVPICGTTTENQEIESINLFELYPNPSNGHFSVEIEFDESREAEFLIHNVLGQGVFNRQLKGQSFVVPMDLSVLGSGVYFARLKSNQEESVIRFLIVE